VLPERKDSIQGRSKLALMGQQGHQPLVNQRRRSRARAAVARQAGDSQHSMPFDGLSLVLVTPSRKEKRLRQHARWGTRKSSADLTTAEPLGLKASGFGVRISRVVGHWLVIRWAAASSALPGGASAGGVVCPAGPQQQTGEAQRLGLLGHRKRPPPNTAGKAASEGGQKRSPFGESRFNQLRPFGQSRDAGGIRPFHGCGWI